MSHRHQVIALSKLMAYILGHRPDEFGLVLDQDGFATLKELQQAISEEEGWSYVRTSHITEVAYSVDREHLEIAGDRIRCVPPHAIQNEVALPPSTLYYGTRRRAYPHILQRGLDPGGKQYASLTAEPQLALRIGRRRDPNPILVEIQAQRACDEGITFYHANPLIYLAAYIPPVYLSGPPVAKVLPEKKQAPPRHREKQAEPPIVRELPGSVLLNLRMEPLHKEEKGKGWKDGSRRNRRRQRHV
jgi:putative RNA 2'-phosphotransferase